MNPYRDVNEANFLCLKAHVLEEPRRFFMEGWGWRRVGSLEMLYSDGFVGCDPEDLKWRFEEPPCGTAGCVCGTANTLQNRDEGKPLAANFSDTVRAAVWLGLRAPQEEEYGDEEDTEAAELARRKHSAVYHLFYLTAWPTKFKDAYEGAADAAGRAQALADYIDWILAQKYREEPEELSYG